MLHPVGEEPIWFGPSTRPLAGWLHIPASGMTRGVVVVCEPIGLERVPSHRPLRMLCQQLASRGLLALRFHYDGIGDSAGEPTDPDRLDAWLASVEAALAVVREIAPAAPQALVGVRLGAGLVTLVADREQLAGRGLGGLVLWDPCVSGSQFLRQQGALGRITGGATESDGGIDAPGIYYTADTAAAIEKLDISRIAVPPAEHVLMLVRTPGGKAAQRLGEQWQSAGAGVVVSQADGQREMLDVPSPRSQLPVVTVAKITAFLEETLGGPAQPVGAWARTSSTTVTTPAGTVVETFRKLGDVGLFAVETMPAPTGDSGTPARTVVLINNAAESHVGPVRLWVDLSRRLAAAGLRAVRVDLSGLGDSPTRPGHRSDEMFADCFLDDVREVLTGLDIAPADVVLAGLCSGANIAINASHELDIAAFVAINTMATVPLQPMTVGPQNSFGPEGGVFRGWLVKTNRMDNARHLAAKVRQSMRMVPAPVWGLLAGLHVVESPAKGLRELSRSQGLLIVGDEDVAGYLTSGRWDVWQATRSGALRFAAVSDLHHVPMARRQRVRLLDLLEPELLRYATISSPTGVTSNSV